MLDDLKLLLGIDAGDVSQDARLTLLLTRAEQAVLNECNRDDLPAGLSAAVVDLAVIAYNQLGIEGEQSHSEGGVSRSYGTNDMPPRIRAQIARYRLGTVRVL